MLTLLATIGLVVLAASRHYQFHAVNTEYTAWSAIANLFLLHALGVTRHLSWNTASWSVSAEWFAYLVLFVPMVRLLRRVRLAWVIGLALSMWLGLVLLAETFALHTPFAELSYRGVLRIVPEFLCGYALYRILEIAKPRRGDIFWMSGIAGILCLCFFSGLTFLLAPCIGLVLLGLYWGGPLADAVWGNRLAVRIGEASFSIYMQQGVFPDRLQSSGPQGGHPAYDDRCDCTRGLIYRPGVCCWSALLPLHRGAAPPGHHSTLRSSQPSSCIYASGSYRSLRLTPRLETKHQ